MTYDQLWILAMNSMLDHEGKVKNWCKTYSDT